MAPPLAYCYRPCGSCVNHSYKIYRSQGNPSGPFYRRTSLPGRLCFLFSSLSSFISVLSISLALLPVSICSSCSWVVGIFSCHLPLLIYMRCILSLCKVYPPAWLGSCKYRIPTTITYPSTSTSTPSIIDRSRYIQSHTHTRSCTYSPTLYLYLILSQTCKEEEREKTD